MWALRWSFVVASLACFLDAAWSGNWEGHLTSGDATWILDMERAAIWPPSEPPSHEEFREAFGESEGFPANDAPGLTIRPVLNLEFTATDLLLRLWPVAVVAGLLYAILRRGRRDLILHCALYTGAGMTMGASVCLGLWLAHGGWGPPWPAFFGGTGWAGGLIVGFVFWTVGDTRAGNG
jgi:hypothetical protein